MLLIPFSSMKNLLSCFGDREFEYDEVLSRQKMPVGKHSAEVRKLCFAEQIHSDGIAVVSEKNLLSSGSSSPVVFPGVDALITNRTDILLSVKFADCIPVLMYDPHKRIIAAIHSGRNGTEKNISGKAIEQMVSCFSTDPADIHVSLGPSICADHYPVSEEVFKRFTVKTEIKQRYPNLDLKKTVKKQILNQGVQERNISDFSICTFEDVNYYSYRRDGTTRRQISIIGMLNG